MAKIRVILELDDIPISKDMVLGWQATYKNAHEALYALFGDDEYRRTGASHVINQATVSMTVETIPMPRGFSATNRPPYPGSDSPPNPAQPAGRS